MIVVIDEPADAGLKIARQVVVFQQDAVLQRLMLTFDLALRLRMVRRAANVSHVLGFLKSQPVQSDQRRNGMPTSRHSLHCKKFGRY